jgi:hypothetical protein
MKGTVLTALLIMTVCVVYAADNSTDTTNYTKPLVGANLPKRAIDPYKNPNMTAAENKKIKESMFKTPVSSKPANNISQYDFDLLPNRSMLRNITNSSCSKVDVAGAFTFNTSAAIVKFNFGYYIYYYITGKFN